MMRIAAASLVEGQTVKFRPRGHSMFPLIKSGELVTVEPIKDKYSLVEGDIVLCKVNGRLYLHKITNVKLYSDGITFEISNNKGHVNGWTQRIYGIVTKVEA